MKTHKFWSLVGGVTGTLTISLGLSVLASIVLAGTPNTAWVHFVEDIYGAWAGIFLILMVGGMLQAIIDDVR